MAKNDKVENGAPEYEIVNKLSVAKVYGKINVKELTGDLDLMTVIGIATGYKTGSSNFGDWLAFTGNFECVRASDQKTFVGGTVFLPSSIQDLLLSVLKADKETGEIPDVQFALKIGVRPAKNPIGYEYTVKPLVKPSGADPLASLRAQALPQLTA